MSILRKFAIRFSPMDSSVKYTIVCQQFCGLSSMIAGWAVSPTPRDLLQSYPAELMGMWPISTRVNKPENDDPSILDPIEAVAKH
jgi:hypothetical protein